ncbi:MAG: DUF2237 domain-containing protein [Wenzhouxiangellaceae bacterium]
MASESIEKAASINVFGEPLELCSSQLQTGFYRDGCCNTGAHDFASHTLCAEVSDEFLQFSLRQGNDLITPRAEWGFPGLKPGDRWCLCATRWLQAERAGVAPRVYLRACHQTVTDWVPLDTLKAYAVDLQ